uniref:Uncharacterized protein n=1 Tax=Globisporangium ultimum (strain ATCC 200006 / CBS 805.95 / DAOM BR144) TaxID=431595 RepID=K3WYZ9_GLOUD
MGDEIDPDQHLRVVKALEQVNGLQYRYYASQKEAKSVLKFDSDDSDDDSGHHRHTKRLSRSSKANEDHKDDQNEDEDDEQSLSFDDHIDRILRKTRTIALLKIANNTAEILPDDPLDCCEGEDFFYDEDEDGEDDGDSYETQDTFVDSTSLRQERSFLRRGNSMRSAPMSDGDAIERDESVVAAMRLVRTLSSFLSLPRVISYKDLEMITESLLDEQPSAGHHEDYGDLIDFHVDSARESSSAAEDDSHGDGEAAPLWKRRNTLLGVN